MSNSSYKSNFSIWMWTIFLSNPPIFAPVNFALYDCVTKFRIFECFFNFVFSSHDTSFTRAVLENPTKTFMCVGRSLAMARGWKHARVDPHVNCFIPRRLHFAWIREGTLLQSPSGRGEVETGEPSGLRARYDRGSQTLYYFVPFRADSVHPRQSMRIV